VPKVTDSYRAARRDEIADAVLRRMGEVGYSGLSMADVFAESGLSAGSVYSHFRSKSEIAVFVTKRLHDRLIADLREWAEATVGSGDTITPPVVTRWMLERIVDRRAFRVPLLHLWAEATVQPSFKIALRRSAALLGVELVAILGPWARREHPDAAAAAARRASRGVLLVCSGFVSQAAVYDGDVDRYLATIRAAIGE
jgi:AcrR family transcriptional regulator